MAGVDDENPFEPDPGSGFVWLIHDEGTVPALFPPASVPLWMDKGWKPCAAPPDVDPALAEREPTPPPAGPVPDPTPAPGRKATTKDAPEGVKTDA